MATEQGAPEVGLN